mmetsp:Transcript_21285/g.39120  ORF Transcript_21285/g.39120 Transcript_21285/m.39120 type:complete len:169 (+) Transcript_21285:241-747(+)
MKPDWDKLIAEYSESKTTLVADVDCTAGGKSKCDEVGVRGYPTIKYGDPDDLQDYKGGRDFASLKKFAEGLGPLCSPANVDLCDDEKKAKIAEFTALSVEKREEMIAEKEAESAKLESDFKTFVEGLQKQYSEASEKKDKDIEAIKSSGLGLLKAVHNFEKKSKKAEL